MCCLKGESQREHGGEVNETGILKEAARGRERGWGGLIQRTCEIQRRINQARDIDAVIDSSFLIGIVESIFISSLNFPL